MPDEGSKERASESGERYVPASDEELSQVQQLEHLTETGAKSAEATEEDEEDVLRELYGEPGEDGIYRGEGT